MSNGFPRSIAIVEQIFSLPPFGTFSTIASADETAGIAREY
jgi:hypothetical protein